MKCECNHNTTETRPEKNFQALNGIQTHNLCDAGTALLVSVVLRRHSHFKSIATDGHFTVILLPDLYFEMCSSLESVHAHPIEACIGLTWGVAWETKKVNREMYYEY